MCSGRNGLSDESDEAPVYLAPTVVITAKNGNTVVSDNTPVVLVATQNGSYDYNWTKDGVALDNKSNELTVTEAGEYAVSVNSSTCTATSNTIAVTEANEEDPINDEPLEVEMLNLQHIIVDHNNTEEITLRARVTSGTPDLVQWQRAGKNIDGANSLEYTTTQDGEYTVAIKNNTTGETFYSEPVWIYEVEEISSIVSYTEEYVECGDEPVTLSILAHVKAGNITSPCPVGDGPDPIGTENSTQSVLKPFKYTWYRNGVEVTDKDFNESPCNYTVKDPSQNGVYTCVVEGMGLSDESDEAPVYLAPNVQISAVNNNTVVSNAGGVVLEATNNASYTYTWTKDGKTVGTDSYQLLVSEAGEYAVTVNSASCTSTSNTIVVTEETNKDVETVNATIVFANNTASCSGNAVELTVFNVQILDAQGNEVEANATYSWLQDGVEIGEHGESITIQNLPVASVYSVDVTVQNVTGASNSIEVATSPIVAIENNGGLEICEYGFTTLSTYFDISYTYEWYRNGKALGDSNSNKLTVEEEGEYHVVVTNANCTSTSEVVYVSQITQEDVSIYPGTEVELMSNKSEIVSISGCDSATWYDDKGNVVSLTLDMEVSTSGLYKVVYTFGTCEFEEDITVIGDDLNNLSIPNVITPNGDNKNENFKLPIELTSREDITLIISDFKGFEIYRSSNYNNDWNGDVKDEHKTNSTYQYHIYQGKELLYSGKITVLRD